MGHNHSSDRFPGLKRTKSDVLRRSRRGARGHSLVFEGKTTLVHYKSTDCVQKKQQSRNSYTRGAGATNLPDDLQVYANAVKVLYDFWTDNVDPLLEDKFRHKEYEDLCMLFYSNIFVKLPHMRNLFENKDLKYQSQKLLGMVGWLITSLIRSDARKLMHQLRKLGLTHMERKVKRKYYTWMLEALHKTFSDKFEKQYLFRVRFSMDQIFHVVSDIMCQQDVITNPSKQAASEYLNSLDDCLVHHQGCKYLKLFMEQLYCGELHHFFMDFGKFHASKTQVGRNEIGKQILTECINPGSLKEINVPYSIKQGILEQLNASGNEFDIDIFDGAAREAYILIERNVWGNFKETVLELTGVELPKPKPVPRARRRSSIYRGSVQKPALKSRSSQTEKSPTSTPQASSSGSCTTPGVSPILVNRNSQKLTLYDLLYYGKSETEPDSLEHHRT